MKLLLVTAYLLSSFISNSAFAQECCTEEIVKFEKKLSRKYDSFQRIASTPIDGEISSMHEIFYAIEKKGKRGIINGERKLIFGVMWDDFSVIDTDDFKDNYTFFKYTDKGRHGIGSIQHGLHLRASYESVEIKLTQDPYTVFIIGTNGGKSRVDWKQKGDEPWFSKEVDFLVEDINMYVRAAVKKYAIFDNLVFLGGKKQSICYELKTGMETIAAPIGYVGTIDVEGYDLPALQCINYELGVYLLMTTDLNGKFKMEYSYNVPIVSGKLIEEGLIIGKTVDGKYKLPQGKLAQEFQLADYEQLYHSDQNLYLINDNNLVVVNRQATKKVILSEYFEIDRCGNYLPTVHLSEGEESKFGKDVLPLEGGILIDRNGTILNDDLYLMELIDRKACLYLFWRDEHREGVLGVSAPKNKRGLLNGQGEIVLPEEYSAIWKTGDHYLTMKGGKVASMVLTPTIYSEGEWILYDENFKQIKNPVRDAIYQTDVIFGRDGFKVGDDFYTTYEFTKKYFGIGVR